MFANIAVEKTIKLPATARNFPTQEPGTNQNALINPPFCGDNFFTEKRLECAFYIYYFYVRLVL
jgi:hypothetical protein